MKKLRTLRFQFRMHGVMIALPTTPRYKERNAEKLVVHEKVAMPDPVGGVSGKHPAKPGMESAPHYISPVLLRLIASNAPLELDLFSDLMHKSRVWSRRERPNLRRSHASKRSSSDLEDPVEVLLSTVREYNKITAETKGQGSENSKQRQQGDRIEPLDRRNAAKERRAGSSCSRDSAERNVSERARSREGSRECGERNSKDCGERGRSREGKHNLPARPLSARADNRVKETSLPERPQSARDGMARENFEILARRARLKRSSPRPFSPRDCELENVRVFAREPGNRPVFHERLRPASAGPSLKSERAKPLWFRKASVKALEALEKDLFTRFNSCTEEGESLSLGRSRPCSRMHDNEHFLDLSSSKSKSRRHENEELSSRLYSSCRSRLCNRRHENAAFQQGFRDVPYSRPLTAPLLVSRASSRADRTRKSGLVFDSFDELAHLPEMDSKSSQHASVNGATGSSAVNVPSPRKGFTRNRETITGKFQSFRVDLQGVQHASVDDTGCSLKTDFPSSRSRKAVEPTLERSCTTAPILYTRRKPRKKESRPAPAEVDEQLATHFQVDNFKDYVENGIVSAFMLESQHGIENEDLPSTTSSDIGDDYEGEDVQAKDVQEEERSSSMFRPTKSSRRSKMETRLKGALKPDDKERVEVTQSTKSSSSKKNGGIISESPVVSKEGVSELVRGVHESLLVSSRLAEVVDMCCKRGQELLRAQETMTMQKESEKYRSPFAKFRRSRHSKVNRRALRSELKWSIFSNGGNKHRTISAIYGGRFIRNKLRAVRGERLFEVQSYMELSQATKKPPKRPATAPADVHRSPRIVEEAEQNKSPRKACNTARSGEGIGPWTPTPEMSEIRFRAFDSPNFLPPSKSHEESQGKVSHRKKLAVEERHSV